ncbi:protein of unknown function [Shewanella benthica]|uniref:Uncharacterized protein n=1 Tax=Shewanella benthica TaxID=43661 RepID=A0A330M348_9GAMM|nr:protein of unknown function [Shewanella benthica]
MAQGDTDITKIINNPAPASFDNTSLAKAGANFELQPWDWAFYAERSVNINTILMKARLSLTSNLTGY